MTSKADNSPKCSTRVDGQGQEQTLVLRLGGRWLLSEQRPILEDVVSDLDSAQLEALAAVHFDSGSLQAWDTGLLIFVRSCLDWADENGLWNWV